MTEYQHGWPYPVAFRSAHAADTLGAVVSRAGASQLHVAETEKYAHVTYFFNGGEEQVLPGESACAGALAAGRGHLRPQATDERA